jgi:hypothetical protein
MMIWFTLAKDKIKKGVPQGAPSFVNHIPHPIHTYAKHDVEVDRRPMEGGAKQNHIFFV